MPEPDARPAKTPVVGKSHVKHLHATKTVQCCEGLPAARGALRQGLPRGALNPLPAASLCPGLLCPTVRPTESSLGAALGTWASPAQDTSILQGLFWGRVRTNILRPEPAPQFAERVCDPAAQTTDLSVLFPSRDRFTEVRAHSNGIAFALRI